MDKRVDFSIFRDAFEARIEIASALSKALDRSPDHIQALEKAHKKLEDRFANISKGDIEDQYRIFLIVIDTFILLAKWKHAIRNAETDAVRFLNSAKLKASEAIDPLLVSDTRFKIFLEQVADLKEVSQLPGVHKLCQEWPLPLLLFAEVKLAPYREYSSDRPGALEKPETTVAFLKFDIDGQPAKHFNYLKPGTAYDLSIEVRVSNWPEEANQLNLTPITVDPRERDWLPRFTFDKPDGEGPFIFTGTGRAVLEIAHSFGSRPYEFLYAAEFDYTGDAQSVAIVGHRRLLLEGSDIEKKPLTGFRNVDRRLIKIRDEIRGFPGLPPSDIANTMVVLCGFGSIAARALKSGTFEANVSEASFQKKVTEMLQGRNDIGEKLQGHPEAAAGITDLTFQNIAIELKVENTKVLFPKDLEKYFDQTAAYAIGLGKQIAVLSVLDSTPKQAPIGVFDDDIEVFAHQVGQSRVIIVAVIIRGGFPKPSSYSR